MDELMYKFFSIRVALQNGQVIIQDNAFLENPSCKDVVNTRSSLRLELQAFLDNLKKLSDHIELTSVHR